MRTLSRLLSALAVSLPALFGPGPVAAAEIQPSFLLLVPWFEVDLDDPDVGLTTLFAVCNHDPGAVEVLATVHTNWGVSLLETRFTLKHGAVGTFNLRDWLLRGALPDRTLSAGELAHVQAALSGRTSPANGFYYGTPVGPGLAVGYITLETAGGRLWGDYYEVDGRRGSLLAGPLVDLETALCERHAVRFLNNPTAAGGTRLLVWTRRSWAPSLEPQPEQVARPVGIEVYDEAGWQVEDRTLPLPAASLFEVDELRLQPGFGWLEIETGEPSFVLEQVRGLSSAGAALQAWCLPPESTLPGAEPVASLALEAMVGGHEADFPPGPEFGFPYHPGYTYQIENTGDVRLVDVRVMDVLRDYVLCPKTTLEPGESMACVPVFCRFCMCLPGQYHLVGRVMASSMLGTIAVEDPIYFSCRIPTVQLDMFTNGVAGPPGPYIAIGNPVTWQFVVTNTSVVDLRGIHVSNSEGVAVSCPNSTLKPAETMVCTASGTARAGYQENRGAVRGEALFYSPQASDVSYYIGCVRGNEQPPPTEPAPVCMPFDLPAS